MSVIPDELPEGWASASLEEVVDIIRGITFPSSEKQPQGTRGTVACLRTTNVQDELEWDDLLYVSSQFVKRDDQWLRQGDTVISMANSYELVGKVAFAANIPEKATFGGFLAVLRARGFDTAYLFNLLRHPLVRDAIQQTASRTVNIANISLKGLGPIELPLAPLPEQRRIVAKIEALQAGSRKAREALEAIPPLLDQFRQSVLAAAFRGDLTAGWREQHPDAEPASVLLERIRAERRRKWEEAELAKFKAKGKKPKDDSWKEKYVEPEPVDDAELPELPEGWCWATFEEIASIDSDLVSPTDYPNFPHVAPDNIEKATGKLLAYRTVSEDGMSSNKNRFYPGQIVYSKIRPYLSKVIIATFDGLCSADMYPITSQITIEYLFRFMLSGFFLDAVQEEAGNRVVLPKVNQKQLNAIPVPIAPLNEQVTIAQRVKSVASSIAIVTEAIETESKHLAQLDQSILAKAFRGELVPQDPNDEPASVLLERIQAERADGANGKNLRCRRKRSNPEVK